jgi:hypothetical protein
MKKIFLSLLAICFGIQLLAQSNTFPSSGSVGVGTTSPAEKLHVIGGIKVTGGMTANTASSGGIDFSSGYTRFNTWGADNSTFGGFQFINNVANGNAFTPFTILPSGNIGVGTTSPAEKLHVIGGIKVSGSMNAKIASSGGIEYISGRTQFTSWGVDNSTYGGFTFVNSVANGSPFTSMVVLPTGNVGIAATNPQEKLQIDGAIKVTGSSAANLASSGGMEFVSGATQLTSWGVDNSTYGGFKFVNSLANGNPFITMTILPAGNIGIGTTSPSEKLSVNGNISTKKLIVTQTGWSDYVFNKNYKLRSLQSLEYFIKKNNRLPEIPSTKEVEEKGISVGDNQALLLKKIEELTLYLLEQEKRNKQQDEKIKELERKITTLSKTK